MSNNDNVDPIVKRMLANFKLSEDASSENRKNGLKALKFRRGGKDQWDESVYAMFGEQNKPRESYNQIPQFIHQVTNDMRINMPQTRFSPGFNATKEVAEIYEDLARAIQATSEAEVAYDIAADNQVTIGWGYWRYVTEYENDFSLDQVIKIKAIPNAFTIYDDPATTEQDRSDRRFLIEVADVPLSEFNKEYDKEYSALDLSSIGDSVPGWATDETLRIAEYWEVKREKVKLYLDIMTGELTEQDPGYETKTRYVYKPKVMWYKCTACEVLEAKEWPGKFIPYVFVAGETINIDGKVYYSGLVEGMQSSQRQYNYWMNTATEVLALAPKSPFIGALGQFEGLEKIWDGANVKNYPYLPYKPVTINGTLAPPPQRNSASADISAMLSMVQMAQQNFYTTTGIYAASLGQPSNETSGRAILARQQEGDVSTFHFSDNMARALRFGGRILADLFPKIYDGARVLSLLKEDGKRWSAQVNQEIIDQSGQVVNLDLTVGIYDVAVTTGPSYTTKRQAAAESMVQMAQSYPPIMQVAGPQIVRSMDWPGSDEIADALERAMPPELRPPENGEDMPPQAQAAIMAAQQQVEQIVAQFQEVAKQLQEAQAKLQDKTVENQLKEADIMAKREDAMTKAQLEMAKIALENRKLDIEEYKAKMGVLQSEFNADAILGE